MTGDRCISRRRVLRTGGIGIAGLIGVTGNVAGQDDEFRNRLRIESSYTNVEYWFSVSGEVGPERDVDDSDEINEKRISGTLNSDDEDMFWYSGRITEFRHSGPVEVFINGRRVKPDSSGGLKTIRVQATPGGTHATYQLTVSGDLINRDKYYKQDNGGGGVINGATASGTLQGGGTPKESINDAYEDLAFNQFQPGEVPQFNAYLYTGKIIGFRHNDRPIRVFVNGREVDPDSLGRPLHELRVESSSRLNAIEYNFTVSGALMPGAEFNTTPGEIGDDISSTTDSTTNVSDTASNLTNSTNLSSTQSTKSGNVGSGQVKFNQTDSFWFSGDIIEFEVTNDSIDSVRLLVDGSEIDPESLAQPLQILQIKANESEALNYKLSVTGDLEPGPEFDTAPNVSHSISNDSTATGWVTEEDVDSYWFSGRISKFEVINGETNWAGLSIDGREVPDSNRPNRLQILVDAPSDSSNSNYNYEFIVSGDISDTNALESIDNRNLNYIKPGVSARSGTLNAEVSAEAPTEGNDLDTYHFSGDIEAIRFPDRGTDIKYEDNLKVFINDNEVDPDRFVWPMHARVADLAKQNGAILALSGIVIGLFTLLVELLAKLPNAWNTLRELPVVKSVIVMLSSQEDKTK